MLNKFCKIFIVFGVVLIIILITFVFPVKFCIKSYPKNTDKEFYIVRYDCLKNWWILAGDSNELYDWNTVSDTPVRINGKNFQEIISGDLYLRDMPTYFIVWGHAEIQEEYNNEYDVVSMQYIIDCKDWDILDKLYSRNEFRMRFSNKYLTIYDYKWFDDFRRLVWEFEEW